MLGSTNSGKVPRRASMKILILAKNAKPTLLITSAVLARCAFAVGVPSGAQLAIGVHFVMGMQMNFAIHAVLGGRCQFVLIQRKLLRQGKLCRSRCTKDVSRCIEIGHSASMLGRAGKPLGCKAVMTTTTTTTTMRMMTMTRT